MTTESHALTELIYDIVEDAVAQATTPDETALWDTAYTLIPTLEGTAQVQGLLVLSMPSPILGEGSLMSTMLCDLRALGDIDNALEVVRILVDNLRSARADKLSITNGEAP